MNRDVAIETITAGCSPDQCVVEVILVAIRWATRVAGMNEIKQDIMQFFKYIHGINKRLDEVTN